MFGYDPQIHLPQSEVVCIKYADTQGIRTYIDRKNFVGTLPELIDKASSFLRQYVRVGATIRGFYREDEPEYPYEALREAVVNAVIHRDYSRSGETVRAIGSIGPPHPTPHPTSSVGAAATTRSISRDSVGHTSRGGVSSRSRTRIRPESSTTPAASLVPPTSTAR